MASSSDGIFTIDQRLRVTSWNPAMERITGLSAATVVGTLCGTLFFDEAGEEPRGTQRECPWNSGGQPVAEQLMRPVTARGEERWVSCSSSPLRGGGWVVVARDVTEHKQAEDLKSDFLATVSHELRTPLTPVQGFLRTLLRRDVEFGADQPRDFYSIMLAQAERLERLINDLLDASAMQQQMTQMVVPSEVDWRASAARVVGLFRCQEPDREFLLEVRADGATVLADEQRAEQVLANLLSNAVKYSPARSQVRVRIEQRGQELATTVVDRGPGIALAERERVFERFTRLGDSLTRSGGAGLGLFIARHLVEAMGGTIDVGDDAGGGAAFTFTLPVAARELSTERVLDLR